MENKPDNREDNVERIQENIDCTIRNIREGEELIEETDNSQIKEQIEAKNERREQALDAMRAEIKDEADFSE